VYNQQPEAVYEPPPQQHAHQNQPPVMNQPANVHSAVSPQAAYTNTSQARQNVSGRGFGGVRSGPPSQPPDFKPRGFAENKGVSGAGAPPSQPENYVPESQRTGRGFGGMMGVPGAAAPPSEPNTLAHDSVGKSFEAYT
jgi:hypothetical protein